MRNMSPIRNSRISWIVIGGLLVIGGIVYHLAMVRCPYCGHSLAWVPAHTQRVSMLS